MNGITTILIEETILYPFSVLKDAEFLMSTPHYQNKGNNKKWYGYIQSYNKLFVAAAALTICNKTTGLYYIAMFLYVISDFLVVCYI